MKMTPCMDMGSQIREDLKPRTTHYAPEIKLRILDLFENGEVPCDAIAKSFGITMQTIYNWRKAYKKDGVAGLEDSPKSGRRPRVSKEKIIKCAEAIKKSGIITARALRARVTEKYGWSYSENYLWRVLGYYGYNYKKANPVHVRAATNEEIDEWSKENMPIIDHYISKGYVLLVCDEIHPEMDSVIPYGYAKGSERLYTTHHGAVRRINIVGAIAGSGRSIFRRQERSNSVTFKMFLDGVHAAFPNAIIVMDRASYHTSKTVRQWFEEHPGIIPIYLPPGAPHMNGIENLWEMMYAHLRTLVYYTFDEFCYHIFNFLRRRKHRLDVYERLGSRLEESAEAQVMRARKQLKIPAYCPVAR